MVGEELWAELVKRHGTSEDGAKVEIVAGIDAFREESFDPDPDLDSVVDQIAAADQIERLPFLALDR